MLKSDYYIEPTEVDLIVFEKLVPSDHLLRKAKEVIDFERFREIVKDCYSATMGRGAEDPVRMIKVGLIQYAYNFSDREVLRQLQVNVAFRYFLDLSLDSPLPTSGLLSQFRKRLGYERYQQIFDEVVSQAREKGLVKDRIRLKDATHIIANIAVPNAIQLVAQARQRLLKCVQSYREEQVEEEKKEAEQIRVITDDKKDAERLMARVEHLRRIVIWCDELQESLGPAQEGDKKRERFDAALALAHKILEQNDDPGKKDKVVSATDEDARCGKHGKFYDGYMLDVIIDADSEIITAIDTPPANADEAANAEILIRQEEQAHCNDVEAISIDGIGFRGKILRTLKDVNGLGLQVYVPPRKRPSDGPYFLPEDFHLHKDGQVLICPGEEEAQRRSRNKKDTAWAFFFERDKCEKCPLLEQCMEKLPVTTGRTVTKNDYAAEYQAAWEVSKTEEYTQVRKQHPAIERKLAEFVWHRGGRRTRFRGRDDVSIQYLLTAIVINTKRMVRLIGAQEILATPA
ncbi:MAG: IS1182 family transposase [Candidatus Kariarchaeaceae archaeon]|jgi:transposase